MSSGQHDAIDPLALPVWGHALAMIAEEMGALLVRSALSPNIRERRDASAALFDADGAMVAQAAHIPVHLGAMPEAVAAVRARGPRPGDVFLLNDPAAGGQHHWLAQDAIASVDGNTVRLSVPASQARQSWQSEAPSPGGG